MTFIRASHNQQMVIGIKDKYHDIETAPLVNNHLARKLHATRNYRTPKAK